MDLAAASTELGLSYPLLSDRGGDIAECYGLRWKIPLEFARRHRELSADPVDGGQAVLTVSGRFVLDIDGTIAYSEIDPDFTRRLEPSELLPTLSALCARR